MRKIKELDKDFGTYISLIRKAKKLSLRDMVREMGMLDHTYLCKIERGRMPPPSVEAVRRIADVLGIDRIQLKLMAGYVPDGLRALVFDDKNVREFLSKTALNLTSDGWAELANVLDGWAEDSALMDEEAP